MPGLYGLTEASKKAVMADPRRISGLCLAYPLLTRGVDPELADPVPRLCCKMHAEK